MLLFDEVQEDENWATTLKILYDDARWAFIICTGSSALLLNNTADLARRMHTKKVLPFSFPEFIRSKIYLEKEGILIELENNFSATMKDTLFFSQSAGEVIEKLQTFSQKVKNILMQLTIQMELP